MKKNNCINFIVAIFVFANFSLHAQKLFSLEDAILGVKSNLAPRNFKQTGWIVNSENYFWVDTVKKVPTVFFSSPSNSKNNRLFSLSDINKQFKAQRSDTLKDLPPIKFKNDKTIEFKVENKLFEFDFITKKNTLTYEFKFPEGAINIDESSQRNVFAFTKNNNLFILNNNIFSAISSDVDINTVNGQTVHRNEFGINKGTFWSPKGNLLAYYKMDQRMVADYPIINWQKTPAEIANIKYPMAGNASHQVSIGVYSLERNSSIFLKIKGDPDQYLTNITWSPDEKTIYVAILNRQQNKMQLNAYDSNSGNFIKTILEESDEKYIEPLNPMFFLKSNTSQFVWQSNVDGYNHLYLYNTSGSLVKRLTKGDYEVVKLLDIDEAGENIYFISTIKSPLEKTLCKVSLKDEKVSVITNEAGTHTVKWSQNFKYFLDSYTSTSIPLKIDLVENTGRIVKNILVAENPIKDFVLGKMRISTIKNKNTELYYRLYQPIDFDSTKKYPCIVYLYNGPHAQMITNSWLGGSANLWFQYMAQQGYVVFTIDGRGSDNRGKQFEQATFRNLGTAEAEDQLAGLDFLKKQNYVDMNRVGIHGWSFGGFMTTLMMLKHPGVYKVGVAGGPVIDWGMYEVMYTERYMDTPDENPEGYKTTNLLNFAENLQGKLLLIHGTSDDVVVWQHSIDLLKKFVDKGILADYFVYPGHLHNVLGKDRLHLYKKVTDYFIQNL
ncbi:MAG: DPP IV N-terminal domain-containing protein [Bacteroidota bacterium]|jgi:dipeptidyl-peptidase-4